MIQKIKDEYMVRILWNNHNDFGDENEHWNEICAWALEQFGLPGHRFSTKATETYMEFYFQNQADAVYFSLRWL